MMSRWRGASIFHVVRPVASDWVLLNTLVAFSYVRPQSSAATELSYLPVPIRIVSILERWGNWYRQY